MQELPFYMSPNLLIYAGVTGLFLGILFLLFFLYRRIRWLLAVMTRRDNSRPKLLASLRNLLLIFLWTAVFGMFLFTGFFLRAYHVFTYEKPVAHIIIKPLEEKQTTLVTIRQPSVYNSNDNHAYLIKGDQWVLEGDILKWDNWLNFLGFQTRYRLTRLRGRYWRTTDEIREQQTVYSLVKDENHPFWRFLYGYGRYFPFVSTVYGNAVFQTASEKKQFRVYVGTSGFIVREAENTP